MTTQITKDTIIADMIEIAPHAVPLLKMVGMNCIGCAMSSGETLGEACEAHGVDPEMILKQLAAITKQ